MFCASFVCVGLRVNFSVAIEPISCYYNISNYNQGLLLGAIFFGDFIGNIPAGILATKYGGKVTLGYGIFIGSIIVLIIPFCLEIKSLYFQDNIILLNKNCRCNDSIANGWCFINDKYTNNCNGIKNGNPDMCSSEYYFYLIYGLRLLLGLVSSMCFSSFPSIIAKWANKHEKTRFLSIAFSGVSVGITFTLLISVQLMKYYWRYIFYLFGSIGLIWSYIWYTFTYNDPKNDPHISDYELKLLNSVSNGVSNVYNIPYWNIFSTKESWALFIVHSSHNWSLYFMITMLPTYFHKHLHYDINSSGITMVLPYMFQFITPIIGSYYVDKLIKNGYDKTLIKKIVQTIASVIPGILIVLCGYTTNIYIIVILFSFTFSLEGLSRCGFLSTYNDVSPTLSSIIFGISCTIACIPGIIAPLISGLILGDNPSIFEWRILFYLCFISHIIGCIVYWLFGKAQFIQKLNTHYPTFT